MRIIKKLAIVASIVLVSSSAYADNSYVTTGKLIRKEPIYTNVSGSKPYQHCSNQEVPIYGRTGGSGAGANALGGMIIGGIIGKALGGNDKGAAAGAILGGVIGADKSQGQQRIIGYETQRVCETRYKNVQNTVVNQYRLVYNINGMESAYVVNSAQGNNAWVGQTKRFRVRYQMLN